MIQLKDKQDCCGCSACVQRCPKHCISMIEDEEGFLYPRIDHSLCIDCGLCEKVCPVINRNQSIKPLGVYATKNPNETIRLQSSSGGFFTELAERVIEEGGVVFGVGFNEHWEAAHSYTETKEGLSAFRMSKYVQSIVGNTFIEAEHFLKKGRLVLFSGTPCQISGLKRYLLKDYENLLTVDIVCHGVPSPGVFRWYLAEEFQRIAQKDHIKSDFYFNSIPSIPKADVLAEKCGLEIKSIRFRDKKTGWKEFSFTLDLSRIGSQGKEKSICLSSLSYQNTFSKGFLSNLYLRPSCYSCPSKNLTSLSDITIADFWGIQNLKPDYDDDRGVSAVIVNSLQGLAYIKKIDGIFHPMDYSTICIYNSALVKSVPLDPKRDTFFQYKDKTLLQRVDKLCHISLFKKVKLKMKAIAVTLMKTGSRNKK